MINKFDKDLELLSSIFPGKKEGIDRAVVNFSSWKDANYGIHTFIYAENDCKGDVCGVRNSIEKIFNSFVGESNCLHGFWEEKIETFEDKLNIEFLMLVSYVYMRLQSSKEREVETATCVAGILIMISFDISPYGWYIQQHPDPEDQPISNPQENEQMSRTAEVMGMIREMNNT